MKGKRNWAPTFARSVQEFLDIFKNHHRECRMYGVCVEEMLNTVEMVLRLLLFLLSVPQTLVSVRFIVNDFIHKGF